MLDETSITSTTSTTDQTNATAEAPARRTRRRAASRPAGPPAAKDAPASGQSSVPAAAPSDASAGAAGDQAPSTQDSSGSGQGTKSRAKKAAAKKTTTRSAGKKAAAKKPAQSSEPPADATAEESDSKKSTAKKTAGKKATTKKTAAKKTAAKKTAGKKSVAKQAAGKESAATAAGGPEPAESAEPSVTGRDDGGLTEEAGSTAAPFAPIFQAPEVSTSAPRSRRVSTKSKPSATPDASDKTDTGPAAGADEAQRPEDAPAVDGSAGAEERGTASSRRRRSRGGRNRKRAAGARDDGQPTTEPAEAAEAAVADGTTSPDADTTPADPAVTAEDGQVGGSSRRRRSRSRRAEDGGEKAASAKSGKQAKAGKAGKAAAKVESITGVEGSTRIEAKKQRRREGREAGRRRPPILSESEFLARRESVDRVMAIRQRGETTQIAVLEDNVLVEHYVALESQGSIIGNVYLGRVQNVLPSMEAAFVDIGRGRNAVLYAGEVNWSLAADRNAARRIENALKPGQSVLVQVTKDPIGHKGARLTGQISLPGRYLVLVPGGGTSGISRKLPDTERNRLKTLLKEILPDEAGVIIRTAAEGASEDALTRDVNGLTARWEDISKKSSSGKAPSLLYAEPDTTLKVVRDLFTEDFASLLISGDEAWDIVNGYVSHVAPDLAERMHRHDGDGDVFANLRVDEQIAKALDRKVWLPSGGSLVIDRTEAMTVVDVNTGKFTGAGGNLEETVTKNNLEAAEEIVRQLRLRDIGGIIVVDFIDMVLETNRDLVLRRLVECLGRDRTRHQVAEVTSLGLVQMTRKRISTGLLEAFSHTCEACQGRGVLIESDPIEPQAQEESAAKRSGSGSASGSGTASPRRSGSRRRGGKSGGRDAADNDSAPSDEAAAGDESQPSDETSPAERSEADAVSV